MKFGKVLWSAAMACSLFTGCGSSSDKPENDKLTVGFIYVGPVGDGGWSYAQDQARQKMEKELDVKTIYAESVPEDAKVKDTMRNMIDQGAEVIVAGSFGYMEYVEQVSREYPDVKFLHCAGYKNTPNMANFFGRIYQPRYLSGIIAGLKTKTNKIGYVAAFEIPEVIRGINAFTLGVRSVNPKAEVHVRWTHTWYDPAKEKEAGLALLDEKCDIIAQHQDTAGPQQAAQEKGAWSIGYNSDMKAMAPKSYMTAPVWYWTPYFVQQIKDVQNGTWKSHSYWGGMKDGIVDLAPMTELVPEVAVKKVTAAAELIKSDKLHVFAGPIRGQDGKVRVPAGKNMTDKEMLSMDWFVEGVVAVLKRK